jgi:hypothetical protein
MARILQQVESRVLAKTLGKRPDRGGRPSNYGLPWGRDERVLLTGVIAYLCFLNLRVNFWERVAAMMDTGRSAREVRRF